MHNSSGKVLQWRSMVIFYDEKKQREFDELKQQEEEELIKFLAQKHGLPYVSLATISIENDALRLIPEEKARASKIAPFAINGKKVSTAIFTPNTAEVQKALKELREAGYQVELYMASTKSLQKAWGHYPEITREEEIYAGTVDVSVNAVREAAENTKHLRAVVPEINAVIASKSQNRISRIVEVVLGAAIALDASDVHIEPEEKHARLRFRLDGILQDVTFFDMATYGMTNSRIKILSRLKLNLKNQAQDGRFSVDLGYTKFEVRVSVIPGSYGESVVLRLLDPKSISASLEDLGMHTILLAAVKKEIAKPNGMILTTGPTGSGKTTTLYAFLRKVHVPGVKIITIEDPVEYHLEGITQTQVDTEKQYTFANGLRSAMRQDPDVIMIGEIRDEETAGIAINASLTGHLVFSTLHTNNAAGSFPRLIDLGVDPKTIASAITIAMAQRLVRKLCQVCKEERPIPEADQKRIGSVLKTMPKAVSIPQEKKYWIAKGCDKCNNIGYTGRTGVFEGILVDREIEKIARENPSEREIAATAASQGIPTMQQDGVLKVLMGITSLQELERVVNLE